MKKPSLYDALSQLDDNTEKKAFKYTNEFTKLVIQNRIPYNTQLELTPICNFNCKICYVHMTNENIIALGKSVMRFPQWKYYIDGLSDLGVMSFTITGGECTIHPDFVEIYKYIYDKGKSIVIMTNASNITDEILDLFVQKPPEKIKVTLYGASEETYKNFCGVDNAYNKVFTNIDRMLSKKLNVIFSYTVSKDNICDFEALYEYAKSKAIKIQTENNLLNYNNSDSATVDENSVLQSEYDEAERSYWKKSLKITDEEYEKRFLLRPFSTPHFDTQTKKGLTCAAGRSLLVVDWEGYLKPCNTMDVLKLDPKTEGGFE